MLRLSFLFAVASALWGQSGRNVLLVANRNDAESRQIAGYYRPRRSVPVANVCLLDASVQEEIDWETYIREIEGPIGACLGKGGLRESVLYIVLTKGVPLKIAGGGSGMAAEHGSVDSELALLYAKLRGARFSRAGGVPNPLFMKRDAVFRHPEFPVYLVTRLAAYDWKDAKAMIDRSLAARNRGVFVIDGGGGGGGNQWLRTAAMLLPNERVIADDGPRAVYDRKGVIGYASWGSNDAARTRRWLGFEWLPGAIATDFVSSNGRTLKRPPDDWVFKGWNDAAHMFGGSSQGLSADLIHEGATGASANTYEPYLGGCVRPDYLLPAYCQGRNLAESFYIALPMLSWQGVILGDPLCSLGKP